MAAGPRGSTRVIQPIFTMKTAIISAVTMYALAFAISLAVAVLIKLLYAVVRRVNGSK
jgi:hypothetical protein